MNHRPQETIQNLSQVKRASTWHYCYTWGEYNCHIIECSLKP
jgi:hypothetical protein